MPTKTDEPYHINSFRICSQIVEGSGNARGYGRGMGGRMGGRGFGKFFLTLNISSNQWNYQ